MTKNKIPSIPSSEITPKDQYFNRRQFMKAATITAAGAVLAACGIASSPDSPTTGPSQAASTPGASNFSGTALPPTATTTIQDELGNPANTFEAITHYNNYYEFSEDKSSVARLSQDMPIYPWQVAVGGLVNNPRTYDIDELRAFPQEERVYRLRCVEAWSMVIPWTGFPLSLLIKEVEPTTSAKYVKFTTVMDTEHMPGLRSPFYPWPYIEALRLDEAMNDLAILVTGMYGEELLPQNGAPLRLAVPWKYGFKSGKSLLRIDFTEEMPQTFWNKIAPNEYGFYANVNPDVSHPRWSQRTERRIGEDKRRDTLLFNGYADQVAQLYSDLDLQVNY